MGLECQSPKYTATSCLPGKQNLNTCGSEHMWIWTYANLPRRLRLLDPACSDHPCWHQSPFPTQCCKPKSSSLILQGRTWPPWTMIALIHPKPLASYVRALWMPVCFPSGLKHHHLSLNLPLPRHIQALTVSAQRLLDYIALRLERSFSSRYPLSSATQCSFSVQLLSMSKFLKNLLANRKYILLAFFRISISGLRWDPIGWSSFIIFL